MCSKNAYRREMGSQSPIKAIQNAAVVRRCLTSYTERCISQKRAFFNVLDNFFLKNGPAGLIS